MDVNEADNKQEHDPRLAALPISLDTALLVLMFSMALWFTRFLPTDAPASLDAPLHIDVFLVLIALTIYLMTDFFTPRQKTKNVIKNSMLVVMGICIVLAPMGVNIYMRPSNPTHYVMDAAVQTEEAIKLTLKGQNPYGHDYSHTVMARIPHEPVGAVEHYIYLPMTFELPTPFYLVFNGIFGWFDLRLFHLLFLLLLVFVLYKYAPTATAGRALIIVFVLNQDVMYFFTRGSNDIVAIACLVTAVFLMTRRHYISSAIILGVAILTKQFIWLAIPFYLLYLYGQSEGFVRDKSGQLTPLAKVCLVLLAMVVVFGLPYILWSPAHFFDDIIRYPNGAATGGAVITGWGVSALALKTGLLRDQWGYYPSFILYLVFLVPLIGVLLWRQYKQNTIQLMLLGAAIVTFVFILLSRYTHSNYFSYAMALFFLAFLGFNGKENSVQSS
jgi:hypothetical protein